MTTKDMVPLSRVVAAAIIDSGEDSGKVEAYYFHWAAREFKSLNRKILKTSNGKVSLPVNFNTRTATLPADFMHETFVGYISGGQKVPLTMNHKFVDTQNVVEAECIDYCPRCNQDKAICEDLEVTEEVNLITINGTAYEQKIVKKLYPNGDYYLETTNPFYNVGTATVEYKTAKKFIANLDLKPCGCLETTDENLATLSTHCPDVYGCYYATCSPSCDVDNGSYRIFEETGLIQLDAKYSKQTVYLEYEGFLPKINGQLCVPEVAFEATVEGVKVRSIKNKRNEPLWRIREYKDDARRAKNDMIRELGRVSISYILEKAMTLPKFDIKRESWYSCFSSSTSTVGLTAADTLSRGQIRDPITGIISNISGSNGSSSTNETNATNDMVTVIEVTRQGVTFGKRTFTIGISGSPMTAGQDNWVIRTAVGSIETNVYPNSVNVVIDNLPVDEVDFATAFSVDVLQYKVEYGATQTKVYFNTAVADGQKYKITYAKIAY